MNRYIGERSFFLNVSDHYAKSSRERGNPFRRPRPDNYHPTTSDYAAPN
jgi:hypothetical protein